MMFAQHSTRIGQAAAEHRQIAHQSDAAFAFQSRHAQSFERQSRCGNQAHLDTALRAHQNHLAVAAARQPFLRHGNRRKNVAAGSSARNQKFHWPATLMLPWPAG